MREDGLLFLTPMVFPNNFPSHYEKAVIFWVTVQARFTQGASKALRLRIAWDGKWERGEAEMARPLQISVAWTERKDQACGSLPRLVSSLVIASARRALLLPSGFPCTIMRCQAAVPMRSPPYEARTSPRAAAAGNSRRHAGA